MAANLNLKTVFEADNKDLTRGARQARQELKDFGAVGSDVTSALSSALGVNADKLMQVSNAAKGLGARLSESGNAGVAAFGKLLQQIDLTKTALAGLGIGALVSTFKLLNAEAENFKNTIAGARLDAGTMAYLDTYTQVLHDFNAATGQGVAEFGAGIKKTWGRFTANFKQSVVNGLTGNATGWETLLGPVISGIAGVGGNQKEALANAERAEQLAQEIFDIQRQIQHESVEWAQTETQIAELRRKMKDDTESIASRSAAAAEAQRLVEQRYGREAELLKEIADRSEEISSLATDSVQAEDAMLAARKAANSAGTALQTTLRTIERDQRSISREAASEVAERQKALAAVEAQAKKMAELRAGVAATDLTVSAGAQAGIQGRAEAQMQIGAIIHPKYDAREITDISKEMASLVEMGVASVSESIGGLIGDLATGGEAWKNFSSSALSAFGDMAIAVGKMAIATGTATLGIKAALESLNGYVAIAAGAALVALGTAVKAGLKNVASGNYSASASVAPSSYGSGATGSAGYSTSALKIELSGKLTASGRDLEYVLNEESYRKKNVT